MEFQEKIKEEFAQFLEGPNRVILRTLIKNNPSIHYTVNSLDSIIVTTLNPDHPTCSARKPWMRLMVRTARFRAGEVLE